MMFLSALRMAQHEDVNDNDTLSIVIKWRSNAGL